MKLVNFIKEISSIPNTKYKLTKDGKSYILDYNNFNNNGEFSDAWEDMRNDYGEEIADYTHTLDNIFETRDQIITFKEFYDYFEENKESWGIRNIMALTKHNIEEFKRYDLIEEI
jgi:hypothetical protein